MKRLQGSFKNLFQSQYNEIFTNVPSQKSFQSVLCNLSNISKSRMVYDMLNIHTASFEFRFIRIIGIHIYATCLKVYNTLKILDFPRRELNPGLLGESQLS